MNEKPDGHVRIAAAACYDRSARDNGYSFVRLDLSTGDGEVWLRRYDPEGGGWVPRVIAGKTEDNGRWRLRHLGWLKALISRRASEAPSTLERPSPQEDEILLDGAKNATEAGGLSVSMIGPGDRYVGRPASYLVTVTNYNDVTASDAILTSTIPPGTAFASASDGGQSDGKTITWRLGTVTPGVSRSVSFTVSAMSPCKSRNLAQVTARFPAGTAECLTTIKGIPVVLLGCVDNPDPVQVGFNTTYTITATNQGSADATNLRIVALVQPEAQYVSSTGATPGTAAGQSITFAAIPVLAPKASASWQVTVKATKPGDTRFQINMITDQNLQGETIQETESTHFYE